MSSELEFAWERRELLVTSALLVLVFVVVFSLLVVTVSDLVSLVGGGALETCVWLRRISDSASSACGFDGSTLTSLRSW